jgi:adenylate kinase
MNKIKIIIASLLFCFALQADHIILLGPPGSGKGTLCQSLCAEYGYEHICVGDVLRTEIKNQTDLGKKIEKIVKRGDYIDVSIVAEIVSSKIKLILEQEKQFILDGFPRSFACLPELEKVLKRFDIENEIICICLQADDDVCAERIGGRLVCFGCYNVYNMHEHQLIEHDACPKCALPLVRRLNDDAGTVLKRLKHHHLEIEPVIDCLREKYQIYTVTTVSTSEAVLHKVIGCLK